MNIHSIKVPSQCLKREIPVNVTMPDSPSGKWLLLLHGYGGNKDQWLIKSPIADFANQYGITLAAPSCGDGYYEDTQEPMGCFLGEELPAFLHTHFLVSTDRKDSSVVGCSMGGFGALLIGAQYSNVFGKIVSFGGAFIIHDVAIGNPGVLGKADVRYLRGVFGDFSILEGSERDPLWHTQKAVEDNRMSPVWLLCGRDDVLYRCNEKMYETLSRMGVQVKLIGTIGGHNWSAWNQHIEAMMKWLINLP